MLGLNLNKDGFATWLSSNGSIFCHIKSALWKSGQNGNALTSGGPPDNLSKSAHVLHPELASNSVLRNVIVWRSLRNMFRRSMISSTSIAITSTKSKRNFSTANA